MCHREICPRALGLLGSGPRAGGDTRIPGTRRHRTPHTVILGAFIRPPLKTHHHLIPSQHHHHQQHHHHHHHHLTRTRPAY
eukprot:2531402-Pyramimonas_sp.AAC.1